MHRLSDHEVENIDQDSEDEAPVMQSQQHNKMLSGTVLWCNRCGVYADQKTKGLKR